MSQQGSGPVSWAEVFCASCMDDVLRRGWGPKHVPRLRGEVDCDACAALVQAKGDELGWPLTTYAWLTCPEALSPPAVAMHEAAHAVVAERGGLIVTGVHIGERDLNIDGHATQSGGHFTAEAPEGGVPMSAFAEAFHAGAAGTRLWMAENGLGDDLGAQMAAAYGGSSDMQVMAKEFDDPQMHEQALANADALVREHRREIDEVATELIRLREQGKDMGRQSLHIAMDRAQQASKNRAHNDRPSAQRDTGVPAEPKGTTTATAAVATSSAGGAGLAGIEYINFVIAQATQNSEQIRGALAQVQQWAEEIAAQLQGVLHDSTQPEVMASIAVFAQASQQVTEMQGLVDGAIEGIESYRERL